MNQEILTVTVSQLNNYVKRVIENNSYLKDIWIKGEISNLKQHSSGHIYMTLKDEGANLRAVMFRSAAVSLRFSPENGMKILARGRISVYERDGQYQLYIEALQPDGVGALHIAFEQLKARLAEECLFDEKYKKPIPQYPETIGVVTAATGAAVRDIINVLGRRYPQAKVKLRPVLVQGDGAAKDIADAIAFFNEHKLCDVLIVGRGGGSIEDLWAFNEEIVARAVFASEIPVISAVGHETDFTICDFVADRRAPTPSAAAEIAVPSVSELITRINSLNSELILKMNYKTERLRKNLERLASASVLSNFSISLTDRKMRLDLAQSALEQKMSDLIKTRKESLAIFSGKLDVLSPLKVLARGYAVATASNGSVITSALHTKAGDDILLTLSDGKLDCTVKGKSK